MIWDDLRSFRGLRSVLQTQHSLSRITIAAVSKGALSTQAKLRFDRTPLCTPTVVAEAVADLESCFFYFDYHTG